MPNVKKSAKLILDPQPDPQQHQKLITSTGSPLAHACHVWSTSLSYPAHRHMQQSHNSANLVKIIKYSHNSQAAHLVHLQPCGVSNLACQ